MTTTVQETWLTVCRYEDLPVERGVAALIDDRPVALVRTHDGAVYGIDAVDPKCDAAVLARGLVGDKGGVPALVSPMFKQAYSLLTGECLTEPGPAVPVYPVRIAGDDVQIRWGTG